MKQCSVPAGKDLAWHFYIAITAYLLLFGSFFAVPSCDIDGSASIQGLNQTEYGDNKR